VSTSSLSPNCPIHRNHNPSRCPPDTVD